MKKLIVILFIVVMVVPTYGFIFKKKAPYYMAKLAVKYKKKTMTIYLHKDRIEFADGNIKKLGKILTKETFAENVEDIMFMRLVTIYYIANIMERLDGIEEKIKK
jgi:hypothetical protein